MMTAMLGAFTGYEREFDLVQRRAIVIRKTS